MSRDGGKQTPNLDSGTFRAKCLRLNAAISFPDSTPEADVRTEALCLLLAIDAVNCAHLSTLTCLSSKKQMFAWVQWRQASVCVCVDESGSSSELKTVKVDTSV